MADTNSIGTKKRKTLTPKQKAKRAAYMKERMARPGMKQRRQEQRRLYARTPHGAAMHGWQGIVYRTGPTRPRPYADVQLLMTRDEFFAWAIPQYEAFIRDNPGVMPSVDRIDTTKHYSLDNIRVISMDANNRRKKGEPCDGPPGTTWCNACRQHLPVAMFHFARGRYNAKCRPCLNAYHRQYWKEKRSPYARAT